MKNSARAYWAVSLFTALCLAACSPADSQPPARPNQAVPGQAVFADELAKNLAKEAALIAEQQRTLAAPVKPVQLAAAKTRAPLSCEGVFAQGGAILCQTTPYAVLKVGGVTVRAGADGKAIIGFDRDAKAIETITIQNDSGGDTSASASQSFQIAPRDYNIQRIDGLPPSQVSTFSDAQLKHIRASSARKKTGFASVAKTLGFENGFDYPLKTFTKTSPFGAQRILNGEPKSPHYGVDIAAPTGTPIHAPADGIVVLADDDLYFEGQMVMVDHGQGLISLYLHMSGIDVEKGQAVKRGDVLGAVGSTGRSTGPHLCWRLKWRGRNLDPELLTQWPSSGSLQ